jgi:phage tail-like protein
MLRNVLLGLAIGLIVGTPAGYVIHENLPQVSGDTESHETYFLVEIDGITRSKFDYVEISNSTVDIILYRSGSESLYDHKAPGRISFSNAVLKWEVSENSELYGWFAQYQEGDLNSYRRNMSIILLDGKGEFARWNLNDVWPCGYAVEIDDETGKVYEVLEIACERMTRVH